MLTEILAGLEHGKEFLGSGLRIYVHYKMLMSSNGVKEHLPGYPPFLQRNRCHDSVLICLEDIVLWKWYLLLKKRICSKRSKFFPFRDDSH